jgi:hypothetical protein
MAEHNLYIDIDRGEPVLGAADTSIAALPPFVQGDTLNLRIWLLKDFSRTTSFTTIPVAGLTLQVALGTKVGNSTLYYTQQFTWTPSTDLGQPYFSALFPMNTAALDTLLGGSSSTLCWFEVKMISDALPVTVLSKQVTVEAAVIKEGALTVPAGLTALSAEAANAMYVKIIHTGHFYLMNANGYGIDMWVDTDGTLHSDPIVP